MSAVSIIASADHATKGPSPAVDVSAFSTLRLDFDVTSANVNAFGGGALGNSSAPHPTLSVWLETSEDGSIWEKLGQFADVNTTASSQRTIVTTHDKYVRANWLARSMASGVNPGFVWSITGDGKPDAT